MLLMRRDYPSDKLHPIWMAMLALALVMKALLSSGVMLELEPGSRFLTAKMCTGSGPARTVTIDLGPSGKTQEPAPQSDASVCAFAAVAGASAVMGPRLADDAPPIANELLIGQRTITFGSISLPAVNPPSTGPPNLS